MEREMYATMSVFNVKNVTLCAYPACGAAALADQTLETAVVGVVLALREALDWVRDSMCVMIHLFIEMQLFNEKM